MSRVGSQATGGEDPPGAPPGTCRVACVASKPQRQATGAHNASFQRVQNDMCITKSGWRDRKFVSKGTEISLGKIVSEHFTSLTLDLQGVVSTEDTEEIWEEAKEETMNKVKGRANRRVRPDSPMVDETEVEKSFWLRRADDWVINRKTKKIVLLEFKRTSDCGESYYEEMWKVADNQHTPILTGLRTLTGERGWEVEVVPLVAGQRSVREKE